MLRLFFVTNNLQSNLFKSKTIAVTVSFFLYNSAATRWNIDFTVIDGEHYYYVRLSAWGLLVVSDLIIFRDDRIQDIKQCATGKTLTKLEDYSVKGLDCFGESVTDGLENVIVLLNSIKDAAISQKVLKEYFEDLSEKDKEACEKILNFRVLSNDLAA